MIIPGFTKYDISEDGVVTKVDSDSVIEPYKVRLGDYTYVYARLVDDSGICHNQNIIRLLAIAYLQKPGVPCMARAKDGDNTNTVLSNVEWVPYADSVKKAWDSGKMSHRRPRQNSVTEEFISLLYDTLCLYDTPITVTALSNELEMPYSTVRYAMIALIQRGKAIKHKKGFEAIR